MRVMQNLPTRNTFQSYLPPSLQSYLPLYRDKVIVGEYERNGIHVVRVWNNTGIFIDSNPTTKNMVGGLDYSVSVDEFKVEFIYVIDSDRGSLIADPKYVNAGKYIALMVDIAEKKACELSFDTITMDTHMSLRLFDRYYKDNGFTLTGKIVSDHGAWVQMQKKIEVLN